MLNFLGHEKEIVRYQSFLNIRIMAQLYPYPFLDLTFKGVYFTLVQNANTFTPSNFGVIDFLKNAVVELCTIDFKTSYQHAFIYIRELAITLRKALEPKKLAYVACYNWRYINSLDAWVRAVSQFPREGELKDLLYPLTQIVMGVIQAHKHPKHFSIILKCLEMLNRLARDTRKHCPEEFRHPMVIPIMPFVLDLLEIREVHHTPRNMSSIPIDFEFKLKTRTQTIKTKEFNQRSIEEIIFVILDHMALHSRSTAFPEISFPAQHYLKNYLKRHAKTLHAAHIKRISNLIKKIRESSDYIMLKRSQVEFTPLTLDVAKEQKFLAANDITPLEKMFQEEKENHDREIIDRIKSRVGENEEKQKDIDSDDDEDEELEAKKTKKKGNKRLRDDDDDDETQLRTEQPAKKRVKADDTPQLKKKLKPSKTADTVKALSLDDF
jgi:nucleolar complex protein 2